MMGKGLNNIISSFMIIILLSFLSPIYGADITLGWDANPELNIGGYIIYYKTGSSGPSYNGTDAYQGPSPINVPIDVLGNPSYPQYTLTDLKDGVDYYFAVTAYYAGTPWRQSGFSNEATTAKGSEIEEGGGGCFISSARSH